MGRAVCTNLAAVRAGRWDVVAFLKIKLALEDGGARAGLPTKAAFYGLSKLDTPLCSDTQLWHLALER
jgi:hypothetical protein